MLLQGDNIICARDQRSRVLWLFLGLAFVIHNCPFGRGVRSGRGRGARNPLFYTDGRSVLQWKQPVGLYKMTAGRYALGPVPRTQRGPSRGRNHSAYIT